LAGKAVVDRVEVAFETGGVAFDAHEIGVLRGLGPVQRIFEVDALAWIQMKPVIFLCIPCHTQGLQASARNFDQVLLQGRDAEGISHFEISWLAIVTWSVDPKGLAFAEEAGDICFVLERLVIEVGEHCVFISSLHRPRQCWLAGH
jgi:hypothetical protein